MKNIKTIIFAVLLSAVSFSANSQSYKVVKNELVKIDTTTKKKSQAIKTKLTLTIKDVIYPVYKTEKGKFYILRTSKKTLKEYKQYLKIEE